MISPSRFRFLNQEHDVPAPEDWNHPGLEKLWLYNLHYFDDLNAASAEERKEWHRSLISRWVAENPPCRGNGWEPYPTSMRVVNWIKWALSGNMLSEQALHSLAIQVRHLEKRLEYHLLGNHLFVNAKALVFAGLFFEGEEASRWLALGKKILLGEMDEQILEDGGHFELSPMYHALILEDILDLLNILDVYEGEGQDLRPLADKCRGKARRMLEWLAVMTHSDGEISFFNDAAFAIALSPAQLAEYADALGVGAEPGPDRAMIRLPDSGYVRMSQNGFCILLDAGKVGPDYLPGHAHADTLSFELSWNGRRIICNSGTSCYGVGRQRQWERGTAAHATVMVDGSDSSEVWGGFRVARRAYARISRTEESLNDLGVECEHDGYARLKGAPVHHREIGMHDNIVFWKDIVSGDGEHSITGRLPLHPSVEVRQIASDRCLLLCDVGLLELSGSLPFRIEKGSYAEEFGKTVPRPVIRWDYQGRLPAAASFRLAIQGARP